jgi:glutamyl-tRNA synthetase
LHLGTARTALYNYLFARKQRGTFIMRLEDTDEARSEEKYTQDIFDGLRWLGLNWDEGPDMGGPFPPYRQTDKVDHYEQMAHKLIKSGHAYHCFCTQEELARLKDEQRVEGAGPRYDNRCRTVSDSDVEKFTAEGRTPAVRFKVEDGRILQWDDGIKGVISIDSSDLGGDMVIIKSNGVAIYNFAVVIDDIDMEMTNVIRGEDHIHNTAKQLLIYEALDKQPPQFAHAPLIFDTERRKLSKRRHGEMVHVSSYRENGYMPEALVNYLAQMSWSPPHGEEIFSLEEASQSFDLDKLSKSPAVFDIARLNWFNSKYIRSLPLPTVVERSKKFLSAYDTSRYSAQDLEQIVGTVRDGLTMLSEITKATRFFFDDNIELEAGLGESLLAKQSSKAVLKKILERLDDFPWGDKPLCKDVVDDVGTQVGVKGKDLYWPVRAALCGKTSGPDLGSTLSILGKDRVKTRIESALQLCPQA